MSDIMLIKVSVLFEEVFIKVLNNVGLMLFKVFIDVFMLLSLVIIIVGIMINEMNIM